MQGVELLISESRGVCRENYMVEQGIPVPGISVEEAERLGVFDEGGKPVPADVLVEGKDHEGKVRWLKVAFPVSMESGGERRFKLGKAGGPPIGDRIKGSNASDNNLVFRNKYFKLELSNPGAIKISTEAGTLLDGMVDFHIRSDARSAVGGLRPIYYEPDGYTVLERTDKRVKVLLKGRYRAWVPKNFIFDPKQRYDTELEFTAYADSPVIRLKWRITNHMRFNCPYMWLDRYLVQFPLAEGSEAVDGNEVPGEEKFADWATLKTPGGMLSMAFPFSEWIGRGAGIEVKDGKMGAGGVNPPPDGGFGGKNPEIRRKFNYGMSRTFEGSLVVNGTAEQVQAELKHVPMILPPQYYSDCSELPEAGSKVDFGEWKDVVERAADWILDRQWKGTLWFGEWWREIDVDHNLGIEETNSGNTALGPLYHFYRTGDWRFWEAAKMAFLYTWDMQFCKREDGFGPYMHTRRFLLDQQEWFHPRYQRVGGMIRGSHFFGDSQAREKVIWFLRFWGDNYVAEDGAPLSPNSDGTKNKCTESAMSNFADSLMYAYMETGDEWFLEKAKSIGDWVVRGAEEHIDRFCENSNSTRYILRGLLSLCKICDEPRYKDTFIKISEWTVNAPTYDFGTHYVAFHFYYASQAYKWSGKKEILEGILRLAKWVLSKESIEEPGTYPFVQKGQYPPTRWMCSYDNKAIVSYLPVLASTLAEAGISVSDVL